MKSKSLLIITIGFFSFASCNKTVKEEDKCLNVVCQNNGKCNEGKCKCEVGYEGEHCEQLSRDKLVGSYKGYYSYSYQTIKDSTLYTVTLEPVSKPTSFLIKGLKYYRHAQYYDMESIYVAINSKLSYPEMEGLSYSGKQGIYTVYGKYFSDSVDITFYDTVDSGYIYSHFRGKKN